MRKQLSGRPAPDWTDRDSVAGYMTGSARVMSGSRGFDEQDARAAAGSVFDRAGRTAKAQRASHLGSMFAAIGCQPRRRERLGEITVPTLVVHGDQDPFFPHGNGVALAAEIPGATLLTLPGMRMGRGGSPHARGSRAWPSAASNRLTTGVQNGMIRIHPRKCITRLLTTNIRQGSVAAM